MPTRPFALGRTAGPSPSPVDIPAHHLVTHGVVVGMTGSGKTGLVMVLVEEALRSRIPVLMIDVKGDLSNLFLSFPSLTAGEFLPWVDRDAARRDGVTPETLAEQHATRWRDGLNGWGLGAPDVAAFRASIAPRVFTPGSTAAEPIHVLSALETPSELWATDEEGAREALSSSISLLLRLVQRDPDPSHSRDHVVLAQFAEKRLRAGQSAGLTTLLHDLANPPIQTLGALSIDEFLPPDERDALAQSLNTLLASPSFASWQKGAPLDVGAWLTPHDGKTPAAIVSVAHLDDDERQLVLGLVFDALLAWVRGQAGTSDLRALVVFDEVFGFVPPHPAAPPTKRPLLALLKQARAFGVGMVLATQNPMDLDYKALSNAGMWFVGRLQTDADRERVVEGLASSEAGGAGVDAATLSSTLKSLPPRTFFVRDVHRTPPTSLLETRWTLSWLRGPMTRAELRRLSPAAIATTPAAVPPPAVEAHAPPTPPLAPRTAAPLTPVGWDTQYGPPPATPTSTWTYHPWLVATVVVHMRDARRGISLNRTRLLAAPLLADGTVDLSKAQDLSAQHLGHAPVPEARYAPLSDRLGTKTVRTAAERALRDHAYRSSTVTVAVHDDLGLAQDDGEAMGAFVKRCRDEAARRGLAENQAILAKHEPKIVALADRVAAAEADVAAAESTVPSTVGTLVVGMFAGARNARRAESLQDKAVARVERARKALADAQGAYRKAVAARDAAIAEAQHDVLRVDAAIQSRELIPKKTDVEVTALRLGWAAG